MYTSSWLQTNIIDKIHKFKYKYKLIRTEKVFEDIKFKSIVINIFLQNNKNHIFDSI